MFSTSHNPLAPVGMLHFSKMITRTKIMVISRGLFQVPKGEQLQNTPVKSRGGGGGGERASRLKFLY